MVDGQSRPLIPDIAELTKLVKAALDKNEQLKATADLAWSKVVSKGIEEPSIEDILSHIRSLKVLCGDNEEAVIDGFTWKQLGEVDIEICREIRDRVQARLPDSTSPYHALARWIQAIARDKPVEIFTTNYDLLIEQALEEQLAPYFDGFVGSDSAFLDLESMDEDDLPARWTRLWKIHGSINWWLTQNDHIRRSRDQISGEQLLIYPSHLKYDQSRQMPFLAMTDRLRVFLRQDQCVLVTCGYSFADDHINAYIRQGLAGNPNASCIAMIYGDRSAFPKAVELAEKHPNLSLLAVDGGVIGTINRQWETPTEASQKSFAENIAVGFQPTKPRTLCPAEQSKWLLGDFAAFGQFLANQLASRSIEQSPSNAS
jgi:hypothetical protein